MVKSNEFWFKPKKYGYGSYPCTWEGWVLIFFYIILLVLIIKNITFDRYLFYISIFMWTVSIVFLSKEKTEGKWKWRWGEEK